MADLTDEDPPDSPSEGDTENHFNEIDNNTGKAFDLSQETEKMEVHHHSHVPHGKKNWKSYFREFIMLFLAVFCGFLAEYQFFTSPIKPFDLQHYDFNWMNQLRKMDENGYNMDLIAKYRAGNDYNKADILNVSSFNRSEVINMILFYKQMLVSTRTLAMKDYMIANGKPLQELRKEYRLE